MTFLWTSVLLPSVLSLMIGSAPEPLPGRQVFLDRKCNVCHSVNGADLQATKPATADDPIVDLSGLEKKYQADWLKQYMIRKVRIEKRVHPTKFLGDSAELEALVAWLRSVPPERPSK